VHRGFQQQFATPRATYTNVDILRKLAALMEGKREHLARQIAREGGKPLSDALVETDRYGIGGIPWTMLEMTEEKMNVFRMQGAVDPSHGQRHEVEGLVLTTSTLRRLEQDVQHLAIPALR
jgi:acyl-CoA reductase-like NAD-dependent aldehyde dehydrogenase